MNIIVTGANGFIGSTLANFLLKKGHKVLAIDIKINRSNFLKNTNIKFIEKRVEDLSDDIISKIKGRYDILYHLAWQGVNGPDKANPIIQINNIISTINCILFAKKINVKKILISGSIAEEAISSLPAISKANSSMIYAVAKYSTRLFVDAYCKCINQNYIWMCFSNIYGPTNFTGNLISYTIMQLFKNQYATFGPATTYYDFIYIDDLIYAIYKLGTKNIKGNYFFIGSGKPDILKNYLYTVGNLMGKKELIKIGERQDDGIKYPRSVFSTTNLTNAIGKFVRRDFKKNILTTINQFIANNKR